MRDSSPSSTGHSRRNCIRAPSGTRSFKAKFVGIEGEPARVANGQDKDGKDQFIRRGADKNQMDAALDALEKATWTLASVERLEQQRRPLAPFITSQLQRDASSKLGFNVRRTMGVAQRLYEGMDIGAATLASALCFSTALAMQAADALATKDISAEVVDVRVLNPFVPGPVIELCERPDGCWRSTADGARAALPPEPSRHGGGSTADRSLESSTTPGHPARRACPNCQAARGRLLS